LAILNFRKRIEQLQDCTGFADIVRLLNDALYSERKRVRRKDVDLMIWRWANLIMY